jgi:hypothetical protein
MTLGEIKELVDHISQTWRSDAPAEQRIHLAELDAALAELDESPTDTQTAAEAIDQLRGRIEVLMDEIDIKLGIEPEPIDLATGLEDVETDEQAQEEEEDA